MDGGRECVFAPSSRRPRIHLISFPRLGKKSRRRRRTKRGMLDSPRSNRFVLFFVPSLRKVADTRRDALEIEPANINVRGGRGGILKHFQYSTRYVYVYIIRVFHNVWPLCLTPLYPFYKFARSTYKFRGKTEHDLFIIPFVSPRESYDEAYARIMRAGQSGRLVTFYKILPLSPPHLSSEINIFKI